MFNAIPIDEICGWLGIDQQPVNIPTLGRKSYLLVSCHIISRYKYEGPAVKVNGDFITADVWDYLCFIINRIPEDNKEKTSFYRTYDRIIFQYKMYAPAVAAISRYYYEEKHKKAESF